MTDEIVVADTTTVRVWPVALAALSGLVLGVLAGSVIQERHDARSDPAPAAVAPLTADERKTDFVVQATVPTTITLRFVSREQFDRERPPDAAGFSVISAARCTITFPAGAGIIAVPSQRQARWLDRWDGDALAHEILHCLRGAWHD